MLQMWSLVHQLILLHKALVYLGKMQNGTQALSLNIHSSLLSLVRVSLHFNRAHTQPN